MTRTFVQTNEFSGLWEKLGFKDNDLRRLELEILKNPKIGKVVRGTGKLRKMRFSFINHGKSGSVRVCYVDFESKQTVYFITVYPKNEKDNLSKAECNIIRDSIKILEDSL